MFKGFYVKGPHNLMCPKHINSELEIVYVKDGEIEVDYGKEKVVIGKGQAAIIFPYWLHCFVPNNHSEVYVIMFPYDLIKGVYLQYKDKVPASYKFNMSPEAMVYVDSLIRNKEELIESEIKSLFYVFVSAFFKSNSFANGATNGMLEMIMNVVLADAVENITVKKVAEGCGVSEKYITSYFKNCARIKFRDFINGLLVNRAVELLRDRNLSVTQVAIKSGFGSLRSFNRVFSETMGCTPTQFRKKN